MSAPVRFGLVGAGGIARAYGAAIADCPAAELVAVSDVDPSAAEAFARETGAESHGSLSDLASAAVCDAVIVTTPPATHAAIAIELLKAGRAVLCEKPVSIDFASAQAIVRAAEAGGALFSMASKFRFTDDVIRARDMIRAGEIGTPLMLENVFTGVVDMTGRWNSDPDIAGGGVLIDNGTHSVDIIRYLLGPITEVLAVAAPRIQPTAVEDGVMLMARTETGALATVETSWSIHKDRSAYVGIYGSTGAIEVGWKGSRIRRRHGGPWEDFGTGYDKVAAFRRQIDHFAGALTGQDKEIVGTEDALASVSAIQAAYRSMAEGRWVRVGSADSNVPAIKLVV